MSLCSSLSLSLSSPKSFSFLPKTKPLNFNGVSSSLVTYRFRASVDVPDFLFADWYNFDSTYWIVGFFIFSFLSWTFKIMLPVTRILTPRKTMIGLRWNWIDALKYNDQPRQDYGIEVMYRVIYKYWNSFFLWLVYIAWRLVFNVNNVIFFHCSLLDLILLKGPPILGPSLIWDR